MLSVLYLSELSALRLPACELQFVIASFLSAAKDGSMAAVVFCPGLMGTAYGTFLETHRVLRVRGHLSMVEVHGRLAGRAEAQESSEGQENLHPFLKALQQMALITLQADASNRMCTIAGTCKEQTQEQAPNADPSLN